MERENNLSKAGNEGDQDRGLWLLAAKISENRTLRQDTVISVEAGNHISKKEIHVKATTVTQGEVTAVIENQAEDPASEFWFHKDVAEPVNITVSGAGTLSRSSNYEETIDLIKTKY